MKFRFRRQLGGSIGGFLSICPKEQVLYSRLSAARVQKNQLELCETDLLFPASPTGAICVVPEEGEILFRMAVPSEDAPGKEGPAPMTFA